MTRGLNNRNPGNIRLINPADTPFIGEIRPTSDPGWRQFTDLSFGYRALMKNVQALIASGNNTISKLINKWAPAGDGSNNPTNYANFVSQKTGIPVNEDISFLLNVDNPGTWGAMKNIASAISWMENGIKPSDEDYEEGAIELGWQKLANIPSTYPMTAPAGQPAPNTDQDRKPFYKRPGFWIGSTLLVGGIVYFTTREPEKPAKRKRIAKARK